MESPNEEDAFIEALPEVEVDWFPQVLRPKFELFREFVEPESPATEKGELMGEKAVAVGGGGCWW